MAPPDRLTDGWVVLRRLRRSDRDAALATMRDPEVRRWLNMPTTPGEVEFGSHLRHVAEGWRSGERFEYAVTVAGEDRLVGAVIVSRRHRENYEVAYLAGPEGRGRGLMTRAVRLVCEAAFEAGFGRLELRTHPGNERSQRLAVRCGFKREGTERRSIWLHGRRADAIVWSLLPDDPR